MNLLKSSLGYKQHKTRLAGLWGKGGSSLEGYCATFLGNEGVEPILEKEQKEAAQGCQQLAAERALCPCETQGGLLLHQRPGRMLTPPPTVTTQ